MAIDAEVTADVTLRDTDRWLTTNHPALDDVRSALHCATYGWRGSNPTIIEHLPPDFDRLVHIQNDMLKWAQSRLGGHFARSRQHLTGGVWHDAISGEMAAQALLGWSHAESHARWVEHAAFLERWRESHTCDSEMLERAGLHAAELELLDAG